MGALLNADVISAAAKSTLGVLSLMCLIVGILALRLFPPARTPAMARVFVFAMLLVSVCGFGWAVVREWAGAGQGGTGEGPAVMGQLESGINRQGMDFSALEVHAENAPLCAEMCRTNKDCRAMTYVISLKTCWLKRGVPPAFPPGGPDYISSVKQ